MEYDSDYQQKKIKSFIDLNNFIIFIEKNFDFSKEFAFNNILKAVRKKFRSQCIEYIVSMMMEPYDNITSPLIIK